MFDWLKKIYDFFTSIPTFIHNSPMNIGMVIIEGIIIIAIGYAVYNCFKIMWLGITKEDDKIYSSCINKLLMSGGVYYILKFLDYYLACQCR